MSITFSCPKCATSYTVKSTLAGEKGKCKKCGNSMTIPKPDQVKGHDGEVVVWASTASQVENIPRFILLSLSVLAFLIAGIAINPVFIAAAIIPLLMAGWSWLVVRCKTYEMTNQRLRFSEGVFNKTTKDVELYRIKDTKLTLPFFIRMLGKGNIELLSSDAMEPRIEIAAIDKASEVREKIRLHINEQRTAKGVREVDTR